MVAGKKLLLVLQATAVSVAITRLPRPDTLTVAHGVLDAVLKSLDHSTCSVFLVTESNISASTVYQNGGLLEARQGVGMFSTVVNGEDVNVTRAHLSQMVDKALRLRQVLSCVMVVLVSDDPVFLATFVDESFIKGLLVWPTRLLAVTRRVNTELQDLEKPFSMTNSLLLILQGTSESPRCIIYIHLPYNLQGAQALRVASWTVQRGLELNSNLPLFHDKFYKFSEQPTLVLTAEEFPTQRAIIVKDPEAPGGQRLSFAGPFSEVVAFLAEGANFSYTYVRPPDRAWGTKQPDGSWSGMVGLVIRKKADIAVGPFGTTLSRAEVVGFSWPVRIDDWRIFGSRGMPEVDPWGFLLPLTPLVWTIIMTILIVLSATVFLFSQSITSKILKRIKWSADHFCFIRIILQQDIFVSGGWWWWERLILAVWMLMTLVLTRSYAGNLMSLLAVRHIPQPYQSLRDVIDDPSVTMIWQKNSMLSQFIQSAESGILREVKDQGKIGRVIYRHLAMFPLAAHTLVRSGSHALIDVHTNLRIFMAKDVSRTGRCDFYVSRENVLAYPLVMIFRKYSPLSATIDTRMMRMHESGLPEQWLNNAVRNSTTCLQTQKKITVTSSLSLTNVWGMFVVVGAGLTVSLLVFLLENFIGLLLKSWYCSTSDAQ